jgi:putative phosphonoacetaldehyde dehydrogenase
MREFASVVGGKTLKESGKIEVRNPFTGNLVGRVSAVNSDTAIQAVEAFGGISITLSRHERYAVLDKMSRKLEERASEVSTLITDESGLCLQDTQHEVRRACDVLKFSAIGSLKDDSEVFPCDVSPSGKQRRIYTMRQPLDLVFAITPFNHPLNQVVHKVAPAIAAGAKVLLKPSQLTPLAGHYLVELAVECGLPPEMIGVLSGTSSEVAEQILTHSAVEMVTFTGSTKVGRRIASIAAYKRIVLELGGSSAMLVLKDADLSLAVDLASAGTFKNSGQRCTAIRRILVHESIAGEFARLLAEKTSQIKFGDPYAPDNAMGTVISEQAATAIQRRVEESIAEGAKVLAGHRREGAVYAPTVLDEVTNKMSITACETFGPVAPILRFKTLEEAISIANDTEFGLSGAVVSDHWPSIQKVITELETGTVNVNEIPGFRLEWSPFGGIKSSGLGYKEGVIEAIKSMTNVKTYSLPWERP